jgi:AraC-like DNA-binding protein
VEPAVVRRAAEYIDTHAGEPIGLAQIAAAARVGARSLQLAFRRHRATTPLAYLRDVRMERARAELLAADPAAGDTVAAIATRWGFTHHGHFAIDYRRRYGCSPSQSLRG